MTLWRRFRRWFSTPYDDPLHIPVRAQFPEDQDLAARRRLAERPSTGVKPLRRLVEDQPDSFLRPPHIPEDIL